MSGDVWDGTPLIANQALLEAIVGRPIHPEIFDFAPWGHRIVIVREEPLRISAGGIHLPHVVQLAQGWVLSVGHQVGEVSMGGPVGSCPLSRERLLGCKVLFGKYAGEPIKTGDVAKEDDFTADFVLLTDFDIYGTVGEAPKEVPL